MTQFPFYWCTMSATWHSVSLLLTHNANMTQCFTFIDAQCQQHECFPVIDTQCQQYDTVVLSFYWHTMSATWHSSAFLLLTHNVSNMTQCFPSIDTMATTWHSASFHWHTMSTTWQCFPFIDTQCQQHECFSFIDTQCQQHDTVFLFYWHTMSATWHSSQGSQ